MNTTSHAKLLDRKEKARKSSLQWLFTDRANESCGYHISDRRDVGVCTTDNKNEKEAEATTTRTGSYQGDNSDLCQFVVGQLAGSFLGAVLPFLQGIDIINMIDMGDDFIIDRRKPANPYAAYAERSYYPL